MIAEIQNDPNTLLRSGPYVHIELKGQRLLALLDTGAGRSSIDLTVAHLFGLRPSGPPQPVSGVTSKGMFPPFNIQARILSLGIDFPSPAQGLPLLQNSFIFSAIIGRDVLCQYELTIVPRTGLIRFA